MKHFLTTLLLFVSFSLIGQDVTISGKVTDEDTGDALIGATVLAKGTSIGVVTEVDGSFQITVPDNVKTLIFSYLGYLNLEVNIGGRTNIDVNLESDLTDIEEVVVVGYGSVRKSDLTGSVSTVKAEELQKGGFIGLDQALAGRAPGVLVTQSSGAPGGAASIRIRAVGSLNGSEPLYVIDGIPMENSSSPGLGNQDTESASISPMSLINPADIESIEILKDASSTAIYGSRGANGVVLITTKKGKSRKGVINVDHEYGITQVPNFIDLLNANDYYILNREAFTNNGNELDPENQMRLDSANAGLLPTSDWQKTIISTGSQSNTNVSFSGGNESVRYLISSNYLDARGVVDQTNYKRAAVRVNLDADMSEKFKTGVTLNYSHVTSDQAAINTGVNNLRGATNAISRALRAAPTTGLLADDEDEGIELWTPLTALQANQYENLVTQLIGSVYGEYSILNSLSFKTAFTYQNRNTSQRYYQYNILPNNVAEGGRARTSDLRNSRSTITNTLNYSQRFGKKHNINAVLGQSIEATDAEGIYVSNFGFANDLLTFYDPGSATFFDPDRVTFSDTKLASFFGRVNYSLLGKYLFTVTGRYDGSSKFAANNKWAFFPAAAIAYKISEENFMQGFKNLTDLKLRFSYGTIGNQAISPYQSLDQYASDITPFNEATTTVFYQSQLPNPNLTWETTTQLDAGIDFGFFDGKLTGALEYYQKTTDDLLFTGNRIPVQSGQSTFTENFGSLETQGLEASFNIYLITKEKFSWSVNGNVSTGKTRIKALASDNLFSGWDPGFISGGTQRLIVGEEIGTFFGYKRAGIAQFEDFTEFQGLSSQEQIDLYNMNPGGQYTFVEGHSGGLPAAAEEARPGEQLYVDVDADGSITGDDRTIIGQAQPDVTFGLNNSFTFGALDFSFFIDAQVGRDIANIQNINLLNFNGNQALAVVTNRWTPENPSNIWPRMDNSNGNRNLFSDRFIEDGSFVRLQNITLGYNFPAGVTNRLKIQSLRAYFSASNLFMLTDYTGFTPDVSQRGSSTTNLGHDNGGYPQARLVRFGVNARF